MILEWSNYFEMPCKWQCFSISFFFYCFQAHTVFQTFEEEAMQAPVKITRLKVGAAVEHPFLLPSSFVLALEESNQLQLLLPGKDLATAKDTLALFWKRWAALYGSDHTVFEGLSQEDLRLTLPCRLHGDEGRSTSGNEFVPKHVFTFSFHFHD